MRRPLVSPLVHVVRIDDDTVHLRSGRRVIRLTGRGFADAALDVLGAMDGSTTACALVERFPDLASRLIEALTGHDLLVEGDAHGVGLSFPRLAAVALGAPGDADASARLQKANVAVAGCGPAGATAAVSLARAGVGGLLLVDGGVVTPSDIGVCPVLPPESAGRARSEVVAALCSVAGAAAGSADPPLAGRELEAIDLLVVEARYGPEGRLPAEADLALALGIPFLLHGQDGLEADVGPVVRSGGRPCHRCLETRRASHDGQPDGRDAYVAHRARNAPRSDAFVAAHASIVGGVVAAEALRALLGASPDRDGHVLVVDLGVLSVRSERLVAVPGCPGCGP